MIRGILFDKDGTLVDFHATWHAIGDRLALEAAAGDRRRADLLLEQAGFDRGSHRFKADSVFAAGTNADIVALWYPQADPAERERLLAGFNAFSASAGAEASVPLPGSREAIATLHAAGYRLGVATNDSTRGAELTLLALGVSDMFQAALGYDAVDNPKPAPDAVVAFCARAGLEPSQLAVVGDNRHDVEMARAAGAGLAVGVLSGTGTADTFAGLADVVLGSVAVLPAYLAGRRGL